MGQLQLTGVLNPSWLVRDRRFEEDFVFRPLPVMWEAFRSRRTGVPNCRAGVSPGCGGIACPAPRCLYPLCAGAACAPARPRKPLYEIPTCEGPTKASAS